MKCDLPQLWIDEEWLTKNPERISQAQVDVNTYLRASERLYKGKMILHIGIGNSSIAKELRDVFGWITGITNTKQEFEMGKLNNVVYLLNKYNLEDFKWIDDDYDVIVDVNLKCFACCEDHWLGFMKEVQNKLKVGGRLISHTAGFGGHRSPKTDFDNSNTMEELYKLLEPNCFLFEMKHLSDKSGYYPFIIEKT